VGQAVWLSQIEPVATALERPLSQKTVVTGLLKVRHGMSCVQVRYYAGHWRTWLQMDVLRSDRTSYRATSKHVARNYRYILPNAFQVTNYRSDLYKFIMTDTLKMGVCMRLQTPLTRGMVLAFKFGRLDLTTPKSESVADPTMLQLWNEAGDIVLQVEIYTKRNEVAFNSHAQMSLLDGWGERETVHNIATSFQSTSRFTISVQDCGDTYQVLFNLTTIHFFQKRISINSPATKVSYQQGSDSHSTTALSPSLQVIVYNVDSLPTEEKKAIRLGVALSTEPLTSLKWDEGNEVRYRTCHLRLILTLTRSEYTILVLEIF